MGLPVIVERNAWTLAHERYNADWIEEQGVGMVVRNYLANRPRRARTAGARSNFAGTAPASPPSANRGVRNSRKCWKRSSGKICPQPACRTLRIPDIRSFPPHFSNKLSSSAEARDGI